MNIFVWDVVFDNAVMMTVLGRTPGEALTNLGLYAGTLSEEHRDSLGERHITALRRGQQIAA